MEAPAMQRTAPSGLDRGSKAYDVVLLVLRHVLPPQNAS